MIKNIANKILIGQRAQQEFESETFDKWFTEYGDVRYDYYDNSFQVYDVSPPDYKFTKDQLSQIWEAGFKRFWIFNANSMRNSYYFKEECDCDGVGGFVTNEDEHRKGCPFFKEVKDDKEEE